MTKKEELLFMQVRLIRLASQKWNISIEKVSDLFRQEKVYEYIRKCYEIFHCEGDEAILDDITHFLKKQEAILSNRIY